MTAVRVTPILIFAIAVLFFTGCGPCKTFMYEDNEFILTTGSLLFVKGDIAQVAHAC